MQPNHGYVLQWDPIRERPNLILSNEEQCIRSTLKAILLTQLGERTRYPHLGSNLRGFLFRTLTASLRSELETHIRSVLTTQEERVEILEVEVKQSRTDQSCLAVSLKYRVRGANRVEHCSLQLDP